MVKNKNMYTNNIVINKTGDVDVLEYQKEVLGTPKFGEVVLKHKAIGVNYIDIYHRSGVNPVSLPFVPGLEGAGIIEAVGDGVDDFVVGDRVAYCTAPSGAYSEYRVIDSDILIPLPEYIDFEIAASILLKGLTADYLVRRVHKISQGDIVLVHAAAGGVGTILCQWLKKIGAIVIGTVGSLEKSEFAKKHGCDYTILYREENVSQIVNRITGNQGVSIVYDSVGKDTFNISLDCLSPFGCLVGFGNASGLPEPIPPMLLAQHGSLFFTRPRLADYCSKREDLLVAAENLFDFYREGLIVEIANKFMLKDVKKAHEDIAMRSTTGSTILLVA